MTLGAIGRPVRDDQPARAGTGFNWKWPAAAACLAVAFAAVLFFVLRSPLPPPQILGTQQITNDGKTKVAGLGYPPPPILTDGSRLYFIENTFSQYASVGQVSVEGGDVSPVPLPFPVSSILDISPTGREILMQTPGMDPQGPLWALPVPGGQPLGASET